MSTSDGLEPLFERPLSDAPVTELPSALVPARTTLAGTSVQLEGMDAATHASELYQASHCSEEGLRIWDYLTTGPWPDETTYTAALRQQTASFDPIFYVVRSLRSNRICGQTSYLDINAENGVIEVGNIWFGPELQRSRGSTEALFLMLCHAMDDLGYRRMQWRCNSLNARSRHAAARLGFRFEGIFYNHLIFKGKNRDTTWYSMLDDEWPEVRRIIERWLDPGNFDASGAPTTSLFEAMKHRSPSTRGR
ncbi:MAG: GNAT family N-acetyltransferase [Hyphomicrobiaceae bacterium]